MKENKFDDFFNQLKSFAIKTNFSRKDDFIGASVKEIIELEKHLEIEFGEGLKIYLKHFGKGRVLEHCDYATVTLKSIKSATQKAKKVKFFEWIQKAESIYSRSGILNLRESFNKICFIDYIDHNGYFTFLIPSEENPELYGGEGYGYDIIWHELTLTNQIRNSLFFSIKLICDRRRTIKSNLGSVQDYELLHYNKTKHILLENIDWIDFSADIYTDSDFIIKKRFEFYKIINSIEHKENIIVGLDDFEKEFVKYINKKAL